ncbi:MAG: glycosyltransferase family 2 protein [Clostridiales bacterium]|nr:glycosyltransferase family 2 protein [Clostridiales bacterium]
MPLLTVFTPTYNRAYILPKCYESMKRQSCKDFVWLVVDDGSTDNTGHLVQRWQAENNGFELRYIFQENQGMHGAHNLAYENIHTELNTCIDSDDYMPDDAVEKITDFWNICEKDNSIAGFLALDAYENGKIIGTRFPKGVTSATSYDYYYKYGVKGDKKFILRSDLAKLYPYPLFEGEKYVNLATKYSLIDIDYQLQNTNDVVCIVNYLDDGSTLNMFKQYVSNPKGFAYSRKLCMSLPYAGALFRFRQAIHYVSSSFISKDRQWLAKSPRKGLTLCAAPAGLLLWLYIMIKAGKDK